MFKAQCGNCRHRQKVPDEYDGRPVVCPSCRQNFIAARPAPPAPAAPASNSPPPAAFSPAIEQAARNFNLAFYVLFPIALLYVVVGVLQNFNWLVHYLAK
jgi:hypothetical protein